MDLTALVYLSYCFFSMFIALECIVFELDDYDLNRVILVGETNIVMTCCASEVSSPQYEIRHDGEIVDNQPFFRVTTTRTCVEVTITQVQNTHGGEYECLVTGGGMTIVSNLMLDVRDPFTEGGVYCPQSGETLTANEGDSLSLFCYFGWAADSGDFTSRDFVWQLINGSTPVSLDSAIVTRSPNFFKGLAEVLLGPLTTEDSGTEYQCYHPKGPISGRRPCSVGPVIIIPRRVDVSTPTRASSTHCSKTSTEIAPTVAYISTTTSHAPRTPTQTTSALKREYVSMNLKSSPFASSDIATPTSAGRKVTSEDSTTTIVILSCVVCVAMIINFVFFAVFFVHKKRTRKDEENARSNRDLPATPSSDHQSGYFTPTSAKLEMSSANSEYEYVSTSVPGTGGEQSVPHITGAYEKAIYNAMK